MDEVMSTVFPFYNTNMFFVNLLLATVLLLSLYAYVNRNELALRLLSIKHNFPMLGKMSKWKGELDEDKSTGWFLSEKKLCSEYDIHYQEASKTPVSYNNAKEYLSAVGEIGRAPMGAFIWLGVILITLVEAYGLAQIVAPYLDMNSSLEANATAAVGIALLLSLSLVLLTQFAGAELHKNHLLNEVNDGYAKDDDKNKGHLRTNMNPLLDNNEVDITHKPWQRLLNRIRHPNQHVQASYIKSWAAGFLVLTVLTGFTAIIWLRVEGLDNAINATAQSLVSASWITFALLALVFVAIQVIGVFIGFRYGFAGEYSMRAYQTIRRFDQEDDFLNYYKQQRALISAVAQNNLLKLQDAMVAHNKAKSNASNRYIAESFKNAGSRSFESYLEQFGTKKAETEKSKL